MKNKSMILKITDKFLLGNKLVTYSNSDDYFCDPGNFYPSKFIRVETVRGYHSVISESNLILSASHKFIAPEVGEAIKIAKPPKRKVRLFKPINIVTLMALLKSRNVLELDNSIHASMFYLWVKTLFKPTTKMNEDLQTVAWYCGYHVKRVGKEYKLSILTPSKDKIKRVTKLTASYNSKRLQIRTLTSSFNRNSLILKLR